MRLRGEIQDRFQIGWEPSEVHNGTLLDRLGGYLTEDPQEETNPPLTTVRQHRKENNQEVELKASQVIARIEAAGWKKIRSEGSHVVFEHPKFGRRSTAFGRPQRDVNKHRLVEVVEDFHLAEIEQARIETRLAESKRRPEPARAALARVVPEPQPLIEISDQEMRLLWAQLHRDHGYTIFKLHTDLKINSADLTDFLHHNKPLHPQDRVLMVIYMTNAERTFKLTRNRAELLKKGYGNRTGGSNTIDPFVAVAREAIQKTLDGTGIQVIELAKTIGVAPSILHSIKSGRSKTIYPRFKDKIQKWVEENWTEPEPDKSEIAFNQADLSSQIEEGLPVAIDDELAAIQIVLKAVQPLKRLVAMRALDYVLQRVKEDI